MEKKLLETTGLETLPENVVRFRTYTNVFSLAGDAAVLSYPKDTMSYKHALRRRKESLEFIKEAREKREEAFSTLERRQIDRILKLHEKAEDNFKD